MLEVGAFVAVYVGLGEALDMNPNVYLVAGIPLVAAFQLLVARRPLRALWVRDAPAFVLTPRVALVGALLAVVPVVMLVIDATKDAPVALYLWDLAALAGAFVAAWALTQFTERTLRLLGLCLVTAVPIGLFWLVGVELLDDAFFHRAADEPSFDLLVFGQYLFLYFPSVFVMEEVVFRGALDSHVQHEGERHGLLTAIYISVLWGLWHIPVRGHEPIVALVVVMGTTGILLSIFWRRSGNLGVSGGAHAFMDSVRNGFGNFPA